MLPLLEGQTLHLATLQTMYAKDILFDKDTQVFSTWKEPIRYLGKKNTSEERDYIMMVVRLKIFEFSEQLYTELSRTTKSEYIHLNNKEVNSKYFKRKQPSSELLDS